MANNTLSPTQEALKEQLLALPPDYLMSDAQFMGCFGHGNFRTLAERFCDATVTEVLAGSGCSRHHTGRFISVKAMQEALEAGTISIKPEPDVIGAIKAYEATPKECQEITPDKRITVLILGISNPLKDTIISTLERDAPGEFHVLTTLDVDNAPDVLMVSPSLLDSTGSLGNILRILDPKNKIPCCWIPENGVTIQPSADLSPDRTYMISPDVIQEKNFLADFLTGLLGSQQTPKPVVYTPSLPGQHGPRGYSAQI